VKSEECGRAPGRREGAWPRRIAALGALGGLVAAGGGIGPTSPQFQNAQKACQRLDNGFNMDTSNFPS